MEKRSNTRVVFEVSAVIKYDNKTISGSVINLSLNGLLIRTEEGIPKDTNVNVIIMMEGTTSQLTINLEGVAVRSDRSEIAVEFKSIDLDSFIHLKNIVIYNEGDEEKIMKEFYDSVRSTNQNL
jgi:hypothetical protein